MEVHECALKRPLNRVFRILLIAKYSESIPIDPRSMSFVQLSESIGASRFCLRYQHSLI
jgi:hypothetical protein